MSGWGRVSLLLGAGVLLGAGCGGRTEAFDWEDGPPDDGAGAEAGSLASGGAGLTPIAGRSSRGGTRNVAGSKGVGATSAVGGYSLGGAGPIPVAGASGSSFAGSSYGGYSFAGAPGGGYGGYGFGGGFPVAGYAGYNGFGGSSYAGFGAGGYGIAGQGPQGCLSCVAQECGAELAQCLQDYGCLAILSCMQTYRCQLFECYSPDTCQGTIDTWGGPAGPQMRELLSTFSCAVTSGCSCN